MTAKLASLSVQATPGLHAIPDSSKRAKVSVWRSLVSYLLPVWGIIVVQEIEDPLHDFRRELPPP